MANQISGATLAVASSPKTSKPKQKLHVPDTYVLVIGFVALAALLTHLVPAGEYTFITDPQTGQRLIDPDSFRFVTSRPVGLMDFLLSIFRGMVAGAPIIFMVFLVGGYFEVITASGAIDAAINAAVRRLGRNALSLVPGLMLVMSFLGALGIVANSIIAFIPVGLVLARKLRLDPIAAVGIMYVGTYVGMSATPLGPFNTLLAQQIAGLPLMSGFGLRSVFYLVFFVVTVAYVMRYVRRVHRNPSLSTMGHDAWRAEESSSTSTDPERFRLRHAAVLAALVAGFAIYACGTMKLDWSVEHLAAVMLAVALLAGLLGRMHPDLMARSFIKGCQNMVYGAMVIGFARSITVVLEEGQIIHTLIHAMAVPLSELPALAAAEVMFLVNLVFNFFVPSGSGQAMIVMPLFAPVADVVGVSRQITVSAYQYGDGFSNTIIPTSGVLMAVLGVANIPYERWLRFMMPLLAVWVGIGLLAIGVGVAIGWN